MGRGMLLARRRRPRKAAATKTVRRNVAFGSIHRIGERINGKIEGRERNFEDREREFDLYQIGTDAAEREAEEFGGKFAAESVAAEAECGEERGTAAQEGIED